MVNSTNGVKPNIRITFNPWSKLRTNIQYPPMHFFGRKQMKINSEERENGRRLPIRDAASTGANACARTITTDNGRPSDSRKPPAVWNNKGTAVSAKASGYRTRPRVRAEGPDEGSSPLSEPVTRSPREPVRRVNKRVPFARNCSDTGGLTARAPRLRARALET